jgi:hypothetical protein
MKKQMETIEHKTEEKEVVTPRVLTPKEMAQIKKYNLMPKVETIVIDLWSETPEKKESFGKIIKTKLLSYVILLFMLLSLLLLWIQFLTPQNEYLIKWIGKSYIHYMDGILKVYIFFMWFIGTIVLILGIAGMTSVFKRKDDSLFNKSTLNIWKGNNKFRKIYNKLFFIAVIVGLIINGYVWLPVFWLINIIIWSVYGSILKDKVQKKMNQIISEE